MIINMGKKVAVFCAEGLGDALMMMIASCSYQKQGYEVVTYTNHLKSFGPWFSGFTFKNKPEEKNYEKELSAYDSVILQHENSHKAKAVYELKRQNKLKDLIVFYNNYRKQKHYPIREGKDFAFDEKKPVVENLSHSLKTLLQLSHYPKEIGLRIPKDLTHRKNRRRVIIHPTSSSTTKNWHLSKFVALAKKLLRKGFHPCVCITKEERPNFLFLQEYGIDVPLLRDLSDLATWLYEAAYFIGNDSGPAHLASYLQIPSVVIAPLKQSISHWQPGWKKASLVLPPNWVPNVKGLRLREKHWAYFVTVNTVYKAFQKIKP